MDRLSEIEARLAAALDPGEQIPTEGFESVVTVSGDLRWLLDQLREAERERDDARAIVYALMESQTWQDWTDREGA